MIVNSANNFELRWDVLTLIPLVSIFGSGIAASAVLDITATPIDATTGDIGCQNKIQHLNPIMACVFDINYKAKSWLIFLSENEVSLNLMFNMLFLLCTTKSVLQASYG
ncbi:MAG: hypothetical protein ACI9NY_000954 [Kiritimatiellia bacterium]|jgi:hypothetical protein